LTEKLIKYINYPIYYHPLRWIDTFFFNFRLIIKCPVCGQISIMKNLKKDLLIRECCNCIICNSKNRQRQIAYVLTQRMGVKSLVELSRKSEAFIFNTETNGPLHKMLDKAKHYVCSEYLGTHYKSGEIIDGIRNEDLQNLSFDKNSFDIVISADVFEHISHPYKAHKEIYRVLKPNGRHIFTVPFYQEKFLDEKRVKIDDDSKIIYFKEPLYHNDPLSEKGILVYNIFSLEMIVKLAEIGFVTNLYLLKVPSAGIWGRNSIVFEAIKN
jgi:SAM-dependent methyltransferase